MNLTDYLDSKLVWVLDVPRDRDGLLGDLCDKVQAAGRGVGREDLLKALLAREAKGSTATPLHVAFPHAMLAEIDRSFVAVAKLSGPVDFAGDHGKNIDLVFMLVGPTNKAWEHVRILARIARICHAPGALENLRSATDAQDLASRLIKEDQRHV